MAFKMKGFKPHNMYDKQKAETHKEHLALKEKGYKHSPYKKMDALHNGEPGVQKEDFEQFSAMKKKVSWKYGKGTYSGELIPSKETSTHRYARTHNGKVKSLPK